ncbi:elongation factor G [Halomonas heilongjiangensis]|uniref:Elongation factor G n=1 Tax=Halomonas heilongjiangensis TaxID=1387883 RepID=A0A2N7TPP5_9GAMM|nr:elongation factor G [Halomonas heilongjiangensis]PMR70156.1 elongation factor G [Halomonas heilongjiangensis]PXX94602.1 elongation factor G [Halomonas heilongjiangensis]
MPERPPERIRNVALTGPSGAGKTTLAEALLAAAGAVAVAGSVEKGSTVSDSSAQEKALQHSVSASVLGVEWRKTWINLVDTPGLADFQGAALSILPAVETVAVVVSAGRGIEASARRMMQWAGERGLCRLIVVNQIDAEPAALPALLEEIRATFGAECLPLNLPSQGARAVADCFFTPAGEADFSSVAETHEMLVDQVVELDEELMALYLEQGEELDPAQLHDPFEAALRDGHLVPVCFTSATSGAGVRELLDVFTRLMPNPLEGNPPPFLRDDGQGIREYRARPDPDAHVLAHVVKIEHDPFLGKMAVFRVHQGIVTRDTRLFAGEARKPFRVGTLFRLQGGEHLDAERLGPGEIGALTKVDEVTFDSVLHDSHDEDHIHLRPVALPAPVFGLAIQASRHGDEQKLWEALARMVEEDRGLEVEQDATTQEIVLRGLGELHLRTALERLRERFRLEVETSTPSIAYRESIGAPAEGHCRHKKQTGGAGQFGEVFLRVEPLPRGAGFEFVDTIRGGVIPGSLLPAVEKGVRQAMASGAVAGYPLQDIRVTVHDGKTHPVDSKEIAFVIAGRKAFLDAVRKASPVVLEPVAELVVEGPSSAMGDLTADLAASRGRIQDTSNHGDQVSIQAVVPLAEIADYSNRLNALTGGAGSYSLQFSHYEPAPEPVQRRLMQAYRPTEEE